MIRMIEPSRGEPDGTLSLRSGARTDTSSIVRTKLVPPPPPRPLIARPRLHRLIDEGVTTPLTLVSALPGSGKTVTLASWAAAQSPKPWLAWLSLEPEDANTPRFWAHLLA